MSVDVRPVPALAAALGTDEFLRREIGEGQISEGDELPTELRAAMSEAAESEFVTDSVSEELLSAVDQLRDGRKLSDPYVRLDGTVYRFDLTLPTVVIQLSEETVEVSDSTAVIEYETDEELAPEVDEMLFQIGSSGERSIPGRRAYYRSVLPEEIEAFLDEYEYVEDHFGVSRIEVERRHQEPPYEIEVEAVSDEEIYGRQIIEADERSSELRTFLRTVVESEEPIVKISEMPAAQTLQPPAPGEEHPLVRVDGELWNVVAQQSAHETIPVALSATAESEHRRFSVTTEAADSGDSTNGPLELSSLGGFPSILWVTDDGRSYTLESDSYVDRFDPELAEDHIDPALAVFARSRGEWQQTQELEAGEQHVTTYEIPDSVPAGTYVSYGRFTVEDGSSDEQRSDRTPYLFEVTLTIQ